LLDSVWAFGGGADAGRHRWDISSADWISCRGEKVALREAEAHYLNSYGDSTTLLDRSGDAHKEGRIDLSRKVSQVPHRLAAYMVVAVMKMLTRKKMLTPPSFLFYLPHATDPPLTGLTALSARMLLGRKQ
jgi:hypothetical protein